MNIQEIAARFDITTEESDRIAETAATEAEFVATWENTDWWTDENNAD
tara:strand:+ start:490 stop:633 length:144 start_codon:yes stop_codon:yes gene_type:complete